MEELAFLDATAQAGLIRSGEISAAELLEVSIGRIEAINPDLNAVITPLFEQARQMVRGELPEAPFAGVPFLLKDLVADCAGTPRSDGSAFVAGHYMADEDSELTRRFRRAGFIIAGKSNTSEFGLLPTTEPERFGPTRNPWNTDLGSGGSSGGSAAAVASGMVAAAHAGAVLVAALGARLAGALALAVGAARQVAELVLAAGRQARRIRCPR